MKLTEYNKEDLYRGTIIKFKHEYQSTYKKKDHTLMICEHAPQNDNEAPFALYYIKGYYAGVLRFIFPKESLTKTPMTQAISRRWVIENWNRYIFNSDIKKVKVEIEI